MLCQTPFHSYRWLLRYGIVKIAKNWKICKTAPSGPFSQIRSHFVVFHSCNSCCTVLLATHCQHLHYAVCMYSVVAFTCPGSSLVVMLCSKFWVCAYLPIASFLGWFEKSEKRAWYPLFAHTLNFPTFWEFRIILLCAVTLVYVYCCTFIHTCNVDSGYLHVRPRFCSFVCLPATLRWSN